MTEEQIHEIEVLNLLERELQLKWGRGENIPEELTHRIQEFRTKIKQAIIEPTDNQ